MITKKDLSEMLEANKSYKTALERAEPKDKQRVEALMDDFLERAAAAMGPLVERLSSDPRLLEQVREQLRRGRNSGDDVVIDGEPAVSGSQDD